MTLFFIFIIFTIGPLVTSSPLRRRRRVEFNAKAAKNKWDTLHKNVNAVVNKRQTVANIEKDMDVWLKVRESFPYTVFDLITALCA